MKNLHFKIVVQVSLLGVLLGACATNYVPPADGLVAPPLWSGDVDMVAVDADTKLSLGLKKDGDWFMQVASKMSREGTIVDEIKYKDPFGKEVTIPANTPVHGMQMSMSVTTSYNYMRGPTTDLNATNNPIEWCYSIPVESACIFWESPTKARYISMAKLSQRNLFNLTTAGMVGPMPSIVEGEADFGGPIISRRVLSQINDTGFVILTTVKDGREPAATMRERDTMTWEGDAEIVWQGLKFKAVKGPDGKINAVDVSR